MLATRRTGQRVWHWLWPFALMAGLFLATGSDGLNPTDEGYILAQSYRLLHGQVMHTDFISPRPTGSPLLHVVDFAVPLPLLEASRLVTLAEVIGTSMLFGWLILGLSPRRWRLWHVAAVVGTAVISLHTFPLMAWHTIDGLLLISAGLVLLVRVDRRGATPGGLVLLGAATVIKQSFALAPLIGVVIAIRRGRGPVARRVLVSGGWAGVVPLAYAVAVSATGGFTAMRRELLGAARPDLLTLPKTLQYGNGMVRLLVIEACLLALFTLLRRGGRRASVAAFVAGAGATAVVVSAAFSDHLIMNGVWGYKLFWLLLLIIAWRWVTNRVFDWVGFVVLLVGWMTTLSWGYVVPNLAGGAMALAAVHALWADYAMVDSVSIPRVVAVLGALAALVALLIVSVRDRQAYVYRELPASRLTYRLSRINPDFGSVRTDAQTGAYLADIARCVKAHPAREIAVIPDNAVLYPVFGWKNPFPIDWLLPAEFAKEPNRLVEASSALRRRGDYLVLLQHRSAAALATEQSGADVAPGFFYNHPRLLGQILDALGGRTSSCGQFTVVTPR